MASLKTRLFVVLPLLFTAGAAQTCRAGTSTASSIGDTRNPRNGYVYLNLNQVATCNGTVQGWSYCFEPFNSNPTQDLIFAMYRWQPSNGAYTLVQGSYHQLTIDNNVDSLTCRNLSLQPSERFTVQENDVVAFCEFLDTFRYFETSEGSLWMWNAGGCSEQAITSSGFLFNCPDRAFIISAIIEEYMTDLTEADGSASREDTENKDQGLESGAVAGIVMGGLSLVFIAVVLATVVAAALFCHTRGHKQDVKKAGIEKSGTTGGIATGNNEAYNLLTITTSSNTTSEEPASISTACNEAYNVLTFSGRGETGAITTQSNEAYNLVSHTGISAESYSITTNDNEAYHIH